MYLQKYRNEVIIYEHVTNRILDDLVSVVEPRWMQLAAAFSPRGGITTKVTAEFEAESV
jgi:7-cyano-7-deazaguanine reductase